MATFIILLFKILLLLIALLHFSCENTSPPDAIRIHLSKNKGKLAYPGEFPFIVSVRLMGRASFHIGRHICGGTLLSSDKILTAAHCLFDRKGAYIATRFKLAVLGGTIDNNRLIHPRNFEFIKHAFIHAKYKYFLYTDDIAILVPEKPLPTDGRWMGLIKVATQGVYIGKACTVVGWGASPESKFNDASLKLGSVHILDLMKCVDYYKGAYEIKFPASHLCAGSNNTGICLGDSGGPLICDKIQVGIISMSNSKCSTLSPAIFVNVSAYTHFINEPEIFGYVFKSDAAKVLNVFLINYLIYLKIIL